MKSVVIICFVFKNIYLKCLKNKRNIGIYRLFYIWKAFFKLTGASISSICKICLDIHIFAKISAKTNQFTELYKVLLGSTCVSFEKYARVHIRHFQNSMQLTVYYHSTITKARIQTPTVYLCPPLHSRPGRGCPMWACGAPSQSL